MKKKIIMLALAFIEALALKDGSRFLNIAFGFIRCTVERLVDGHKPALDKGELQLLGWQVANELHVQAETEEDLLAMRRMAFKLLRSEALERVGTQGAEILETEMDKILKKLYNES